MTTTTDEELPPSKLGTKAHWDQVYERENAVFEDNGDEGEVWFGEECVSKMRQWAVNHLPASDSPIRIMECGAGNGTLLLSFLTSPYANGAQAFELTGLDYSEGSTRLSAQIEAQRRETLEEDVQEWESDGDDEDDEDDQEEDDEEEEVADEGREGRDALAGPSSGAANNPRGSTPKRARIRYDYSTGRQIINPTTCTWRTVDLLRDSIPETWDLVLDKGTFDALCLSQDAVQEKGGRLPSVVYPEQVSKLVREGGYFLITSCNFTEEEIRRRWTVEGLGFEFHSSVPHPSFTFGGKSGTRVCTVAFKKVAST